MLKFCNCAQESMDKLYYYITRDMTIESSVTVTKFACPLTMLFHRVSWRLAHSRLCQGCAVIKLVLTITTLQERYQNTKMFIMNCIPTDKRELKSKTREIIDYIYVNILLSVLHCLVSVKFIASASSYATGSGVMLRPGRTGSFSLSQCITISGT